MKRPQFLDIKYLLLIIVILTTLFSCQKEDSKNNLLVQAQNIIEANPEEALILLDSINSPQDMDKDRYMQYLVAHVQAKYKLYQDITQDTLIFEAQKYFDKKGDPEQIVLANFYVNAVYLEQKRFDKSFEYLLRAKQVLPQIENNILIGRVYHNIGDSYYERDVIDSAIIYHRQSLQYTCRERNADIIRMFTLRRMGISFRIKNEFDSAYVYLKEGLELAKEKKNREYESYFAQDFGALYCRKGEYEKAEEYLFKSIDINPSKKHIQTVSLHLAILYTKKKQSNLAKPYIDLIEKKLPEVTSNYVQQSTAGALYNYYELIGNSSKTIHYLNLYTEANQRIEKINSTQRLRDVSNLHNTSLNEKEIERLKTRNYLYLALGVSAFLILLATAYFSYKNMRDRNRRNRERAKLLKSENELLRQKIESFSFLKSIHKDIISQWTKINKEVNVLAKEYGAKEKPELYMQIEGLIDDLKTKTNEQLVEWAKSYLKEQPSGERYVEELDDKNMLLLALCFNKYASKEIRLILSISSNSNVELRKFDLKYKLRDAGLLTPEMEVLIFAEND